MAPSNAGRGRLYRQAAPARGSQRHRPSYPVSPAGQRLIRRAPLPGAAQAVGRHLDASARAMIAAELAGLESGQHPQATPNGGATIKQAAQVLNVGERTVQRAVSPTWRRHLATGEWSQRATITASHPAARASYRREARFFHFLHVLSHGCKILVSFSVGHRVKIGTVFLSGA